MQRFHRFIISFALAGGLLLEAGCGASYVIVQGRYQLKLLMGRKPLEDVINNGDTVEDVKGKLRLIQDVRAFALTTLAMPDTGNYATINPSFTHTIYNVSGCDPLGFRPHTWRFPVVGEVPYKGFFKEEDAIEEEEALRELGLDVLRREVAGYSTLGYFKDPVLPSMLAYDDIALVDLIIHELAHGVFYFKGQTQFNESFANVVGHEGSLLYFESVDGPGSPRAKEAIARREDRALHVQHLLGLSSDLDALYKDRALTSEEKLRRKEELIQRARASYSDLPFESDIYQGRVLPPLNNANLMSYRRYNSQPELFEALLKETGEDWGAFYDALLAFESEEDPYGALAERVGAGAP